jgi:hypothetical protein
LAPEHRQPRVCDRPIGHAAAPTFFWGGKGRQGGGSSNAARLILMGVWCDSSQPKNEKTGVISNCKWSMGRLKPAACAAMESFARLTETG